MSRVSIDEGESRQVKDYDDYVRLHPAKAYTPSSILLHNLTPAQRALNPGRLSVMTSNSIFTCKTAVLKSKQLQVPITLYFMTHAYFCFYHSLANVCIRRARHAVSHLDPWVARLTTAVTVFFLAYATAYGETLTIAHFPYYTFKVKIPGIGK